MKKLLILIIAALHAGLAFVVGEQFFGEPFGYMLATYVFVMIAPEAKDH